VATAIASLAIKHPDLNCQNEEEFRLRSSLPYLSRLKCHLSDQPIRVLFLPKRQVGRNNCGPEEQSEAELFLWHPKVRLQARRTVADHVTQQSGEENGRNP